MKLTAIPSKIPGLPWMTFLDELTSKCHETTHGRFPCTIFVACIWFYILSEIRALAGQAVEYLKTLYKPKKAIIGEYWSQWDIRLYLCTASVALSYLLAFYVPSAFGLYWIEDNEGNARLSRNQQEGQMLVSELMVKSIFYQTETIVWVLGTLLNMPRKRFYPLYVAAKLFAPIADNTADTSGNFALWLAIGLAFSKLFRLYPADKSKIGSMGTAMALIVTGIFGVKLGTGEVLLTVFTLAGTELAWFGFTYRLQQQKKMVKKLFFIASTKSKKDDDHDAKHKKSSSKADDQPSKHEEPEKNTNIINRVWTYITTNDKKGNFSSWPPLTHPTRPVWLALAVGWAACGLVVDGTPLFKK